ncbi:MAG TPA: hypothetical protein VK539_27145 [Myxococcaceae bacterium]|nr:hypothetical protein [Myxococcaceae bacterium]
MFQRVAQQFALSLTLMLVVGLGTGCQGEEVHSAPSARVSNTEAAPFDVDAIIRQVHFAYRQDEDGWRAGHSTYDVKARAEGLVLTPVRYRQAAQPPVRTLRARELEQREELAPRMEAERGTPLLLGAARVSRGTHELSTRQPRGQVEADGHLAWVHGALVEHLRNSEQGVEQSWSFEAAPRGQGELRVRIPVQGLVHTGTSASGLHFADASTGLGFSYGHGTWVDATGQRTAVPAEYSEGAIHLRVPEQVLTASAYPAVLDPVISPELIVDGRHVAADVTTRSHPVLAFNGTNYLLVWRSLRGGLYDLYATRVSSTGTVLDPEGIPVSNGPGDASTPHVASNGTDFFVAWSDNRDNTWLIYGTRVEASGKVTHPGGLPMAVNRVFHLAPRVASNGTDFLVVWNGLGVMGDMDVYGRRISSAGQFMDTTDLVITATQNVEERSPAVASNGSNYLVVWDDFRSGVTIHIHGARVSNAGVVLDSNSLQLTSGTSDQVAPAVASNGTDFLVTWLDWRGSSSRDLYGARVASNGTVVDVNGVAIGAHLNHSESTPAVIANGGDYFVAWMEWNTTNQTRRILGSRVLGSLSVTSPVVDTTNLAFSSTGGNCQQPNVAPATTGYLMAWHCAVGSGSELQSAWVASLTGTITAGGSLAVTTGPVHQTEAAIASNGSNYLVVWTETGSSGASIYGARVAPTGGAVDRAGFVIGSAARERQAPAVASNGADYLVTWMDYRDVNWNIYGARVRGSGPTASAVVDSSGLLISSHPDTQYSPSVASDGTDYLVVWRQVPVDRADIHGARVGSDGVVQDPSGIAIATNLVEHYTPRVASNGSGYLVIWAELHTATLWDIYGARVGSDGVLQDTTRIAVANYSYAQFDPDVASDGAGYLVVWTDHRGENNHDIYGARVSGAGAVQDTSGVAICAHRTNQYSPAVTFDGTSYVVAWADHRDNAVWDIYATQVSSEGSVVTANGSRVAWDVRTYEERVALASVGNQQSLIVYSRYDTEPSTGSRRIRGRFISF